MGIEDDFGDLYTDVNGVVSSRVNTGAGLFHEVSVADEREFVEISFSPSVSKLLGQNSCRTENGSNFRTQPEAEIENEELLLYGQLGHGMGLLQEKGDTLLGGLESQGSSQPTMEESCKKLKSDALPKGPEKLWDAFTLGEGSDAAAIIGVETNSHGEYSQVEKPVVAEAMTSKVAVSEPLCRNGNEKNSFSQILRIDLEPQDNESESEDDLQIIVNDDRPVFVTPLKGREGEDDSDDDEDDLVIVAGDEPVEDQCWREEGSLFLEGSVPGDSPTKEKPCGDEKSQLGKSGGFQGMNMPRFGYGGKPYYSQLHHSQYKYVRPGSVTSGAVSSISPSISQANKAPSAGEFGAASGLNQRGAITRSGSSFPWTMQGSQWASNYGYHGSFEFSLSPTKTVFDIDIDALDEKPWRYPGVDVTDYFNFGFNEETWKSYCEQLAQLRVEASMQSKIHVYESGRTEQPPNQIEGIGVTGRRGTDPRRQRPRDSDAVIQIALQASTIGAQKDMAYHGEESAINRRPRHIKHNYSEADIAKDWKQSDLNMGLRGMPNMHSPVDNAGFFPRGSGRIFSPPTPTLMGHIGRQVICGGSSRPETRILSTLQPCSRDYNQAHDYCDNLRLQMPPKAAKTIAGEMEDELSCRSSSYSASKEERLYAKNKEIKDPERENDHFDAIAIKEINALKSRGNLVTKRGSKLSEHNEELDLTQSEVFPPEDKALDAMKERKSRRRKHNKSHDHAGNLEGLRSEAFLSDSSEHSHHLKHYECSPHDDKISDYSFYEEEERWHSMDKDSFLSEENYRGKSKSHRRRESLSGKEKRRKRKSRKPDSREDLESGVKHTQHDSLKENVSENGDIQHRIEHVIHDHETSREFSDDRWQLDDGDYLKIEEWDYLQGEETSEWNHRKKRREHRRGHRKKRRLHDVDIVDDVDIEGHHTSDMGDRKDVKMRKMHNKRHNKDRSRSVHSNESERVHERYADEIQEENYDISTYGVNNADNEHMEKDENEGEHRQHHLTQRKRDRKDQSDKKHNLGDEVRNFPFSKETDYSFLQRGRSRGHSSNKAWDTSADNELTHSEVDIEVFSRQFDIPRVEDLLDRWTGSPLVSEEEHEQHG